MNVKKALEWCDQVITEIDIELMNWAADLDRMSFAGQEVPLVWYEDGEELEIGTARLKHDDGALMMSAEILSLNREFLNRPVPRAYSLGYDPGPPARAVMKPIPHFEATPVMTHFTMHRDGSVIDNRTGKQIVGPYYPDEIPKKENR